MSTVTRERDREKEEKDMAMRQKNKSDTALARTKKNLADASEQVRVAGRKTRSAKSEQSKLEHHVKEKIDLIQRQHSTQIDWLQGDLDVCICLCTYLFVYLK